MKIEVHLQGGLRKIIDITPGATVGAVVGVNLRNPDGTLWVPPSSGGQPPVSVTSWELILNIPPNVVALANTNTTGLYTITGPGTSTTRALAAVAGETTVANGDGVSGNPTVGLADVADAGGGVLQKTAFDSKGRRTGSSSATTDDLTEGASNLYFSEGRVYESLKDTLVQGANVTITSDDIDSTITISATGGGGGGGVDTVTGTGGITVNNTDPSNPIVALGSTAQNVIANAVVPTTAPVDGDILEFDVSSSGWVPKKNPRELLIDGGNF